jgi:hypothetical protein
MKTILFILGTLVGAYCSPTVLTIAHACADCGATAFHAIVRLVA